MPEQLTKHPEVTLEVLRSAGARCGEGVAQKILTHCPKERFCQLPGGELCVFGLGEASKMTQITSVEWKSVAGEPSAGSGWLLGGAGVLLGLAIGLAVSQFRRGRHNISSKEESP
jgi:hypothetical protein